MKVLYLSAMYHEALVAMDVSIKELNSHAAVDRIFNGTDQQTIYLETEALISHPMFKPFGLNSFRDESELGYYIPEGSPEMSEAVESVNNDLSGVKALALEGDKLVLYVNTTSEQSQDVKEEVLESILNALALIKPVDAVMQTKFFGSFTQM